MNTFSFDDRLAFSRGQREATDRDTIIKMIDGCVDCIKTNEATDKLGVDYVATLRRGARVLIDAKAREPGVKKYWGEHGPDLALEVWSVVPGPGGKDGKAGWTLSERSEVGLILFTFDPSDTDDVYLVGAQHLRLAFIRNFKPWRDTFRSAPQRSTNGRTSWLSECVFVPATVVLTAMMDVSKGRLGRVRTDGFKQSVLFGDALLDCKGCRRKVHEVNPVGICQECQLRTEVAS